MGGCWHLLGQACCESHQLFTRSVLWKVSRVCSSGDRFGLECCWMAHPPAAPVWTGGDRDACLDHVTAWAQLWTSLPSVSRCCPKRGLSEIISASTYFCPFRTYPCEKIESSRGGWVGDRARDDGARWDERATFQHAGPSLRSGKWQGESCPLHVFRTSELGEI